MMKVVIARGGGKIEMTDVPLPQPTAYQALCKIDACATCSGTDQKIVAGTLPWNTDYPGILGHESVGHVVEIGKRVRNICPGDIFLRPTAVYHGDQLGDYFSLWGGFAEYGLVTDTQALLEDDADAKPNGYCAFQQKIPPGIAPADATMMITLKECASFLANVGAKFRKSLVILGSGPVAAGMTYFAKLYGMYPVIVIGRRDQPLAELRKIGADFTINNTTENIVTKVKEITSGRGANLVVDCAGDAALITAASQLLAEDGRVAPYAVGHEFQYKLDRVPGPGAWEFVFAGPNEDVAHQYLLDLHRLNVLPLTSFYSHRLPFDQFLEGFEMLKNKQASKIVFEIET